MDKAIACTVLEAEGGGGEEGGALLLTPGGIAADKVVALTSPFEHIRMMTLRVVAAVISGSWLLAVIPTAFSIVNVKSVEALGYGVCIIEENSFVGFVFAFMLPMVVLSIIKVILNVHLAIKGYQIHKKIERETSLSGHSSEKVTSLKKKQRIIRQNRKPIITLLVVVLGSVSINMILAAFYFVGRLWIASPAYHDLMEYVILLL